MSAGKEHKGEVGALHEVVVKDHTNKDSDFPSIKRLESTGKGLPPENYFQNLNYLKV